MSTYSQTTVPSIVSATPVGPSTPITAVAAAADKVEIDDLDPFAYTHPLSRYTTQMTHVLPNGSGLKRCPRVDNLFQWFNQHSTTSFASAQQQQKGVYHQPSLTIGDTFRGLDLDHLPKTWNSGYFARHGIPPFAIRQKPRVPPSTPELVPSYTCVVKASGLAQAVIDIGAAIDSPKMDAIIAIEAVDSDCDTEDAVGTAVEVDEEGNPLPLYATLHGGETPPHPQPRLANRDSLTSIHSIETVVTLASSGTTSTEGSGSGTNSAGSVTPTTPPKPVLLLPTQGQVDAVEVHRALKAELYKAWTARNYRYRFRNGYATQGEGSGSSTREGTPEAENAIQVSTPPLVEEDVIEAALQH